MEGWIGVPSSRNAFTAEWCAAIREAIIAATGKAPDSTPADQLGIAQGSSWPRALMLGLPVAATVLFLTVVSGPTPSGFTKSQTLILTTIILLVMPLVLH